MYCIICKYMSCDQTVMKLCLYKAKTAWYESVLHPHVQRYSAPSMPAMSPSVSVLSKRANLQIQFHFDDCVAVGKRIAHFQYALSGCIDMLEKLNFHHVTVQLVCTECSPSAHHRRTRPWQSDPGGWIHGATSTRKLPARSWLCLSLMQRLLDTVDLTLFVSGS